MSDKINASLVSLTTTITTATSRVNAVGVALPRPLVRDAIAALNALSVALLKHARAGKVCDQCGTERQEWQDEREDRCPNHALGGPYVSCDGRLL